MLEYLDNPIEQRETHCLPLRDKCSALLRILTGSQQYVNILGTSVCNITALQTYYKPIQPIAITLLKAIPTFYESRYTHFFMFDLREEKDNRRHFRNYFDTAHSTNRKQGPDIVM